MWSIKSGDTDYGVFEESDVFDRLAKARDNGYDVFQVADNIIVSSSNGNVYVCSMIN